METQPIVSQPQPIQERVARAAWKIKREEIVTLAVNAARFGFPCADIPALTIEERAGAELEHFANRIAETRRASSEHGRAWYVTAADFPEISLRARGNLLKLATIIEHPAARRLAESAWSFLTRATIPAHLRSHNNGK